MIGSGVPFAGATPSFEFTVAVGKPGINLKWLADYCGTSIEMIEQHYAGAIHQDGTQLAPLAGSTPARRALGSA